MMLGMFYVSVRGTDAVFDDHEVLCVVVNTQRKTRVMEGLNLM